MPIDFPTQVYLPVFNTFARAVTVIPLASKPGELPYAARGIYSTQTIDVAALDGGIVSDQRTILDIREAEFDVMPQQKDQINIPADGGMPEAGMFEVIDTTTNGGGETTLTLRKVVQASPLD